MNRKGNFWYQSCALSQTKLREDIGAMRTNFRKGRQRLHLLKMKPWPDSLFQFLFPWEFSDTGLWRCQKVDKTCKHIYKGKLSKFKRDKIWNIVSSGLLNLLKIVQPPTWILVIFWSSIFFKAVKFLKKPLEKIRLWKISIRNQWIWCNHFLILKAFLSQWLLSLSTNLNTGP